MAKTKFLRKKSRKKRPVRRIPEIMLNLEPSRDHIEQLLSISREALLRFHYGVSDEDDYLVVTRILFIGYRIARHFDNHEDLASFAKQGLIDLQTLQRLQNSGETLPPFQISSLESKLLTVIEEISKARLGDVLEANDYFDNHYEKISTLLA